MKKAWAFSFLLSDSEDSDQMPRLICVFADYAEHTCHFVGFVMLRFICWHCHYIEMAYLVEIMCMMLVEYLFGFEKYNHIGDKKNIVQNKQMCEMAKFTPPDSCFFYVKVGVTSIFKTRCVAFCPSAAFKPGQFFFFLSYSKDKKIKWTASREFGTYRLCKQRWFRRTCASVQSCQNLRC